MLVLFFFLMTLIQAIICPCNETVDTGEFQITIQKEDSLCQEPWQKILSGVHPMLHRKTKHNRKFLNTTTKKQPGLSKPSVDLPIYDERDRNERNSSTRISMKKTHKKQKPADAASEIPIYDETKDKKTESENITILNRKGTDQIPKIVKGKKRKKIKNAPQKSGQENQRLIKAKKIQEPHGRRSLNMTEEIKNIFNKTVENENSYCRICCMIEKSNTTKRVCRKHTMCRYRNKTAITIIAHPLVDFSEGEQLKIVDFHNNLRQDIASGNYLRRRPNTGVTLPKAANMMQISWDAELATIAATWIRQDKNYPDLCRDTKRFHVGQNFGNFDDISVNGEDFLMAWEDEASNFTYGKELLDQKKNFRQMIWANSEYVGCARIVFYYNRAEPRKMYKQRVICNYGPAGNVQGEDPYKEGNPCSSCRLGSHCSKMFDALCSDYNQNVQEYEEHRRLLSAIPSFMKPKRERAPIISLRAEEIVSNVGSTRLRRKVLVLFSCIYSLYGIKLRLFSFY